MIPLFHCVPYPTNYTHYVTFYLQLSYNLIMWPSKIISWINTCKNRKKKKIMTNFKCHVIPIVFFFLFFEKIWFFIKSCKRSLLSKYNIPDRIRAASIPHTIYWLVHRRLSQPVGSPVGRSFHMPNNRIWELSIVEQSYNRVLNNIIHFHMLNEFKLSQEPDLSMELCH